MLRKQFHIVSVAMMKLLVPIVALIGQALAQEGPLVSSPAGDIRGYWSQTRDGLDMAVFKSIPYAQPPVI